MRAKPWLSQTGIEQTTTWWVRPDEALSEDGGPGPLCWGSIGVAMLMSAGLLATAIWSVIALVVG
jgi:hypothetical protein